MLNISTAYKQKRSAHAFEGWLRIKSAEGFHKLRQFKRRYITIDGPVIHSYKSALCDAETKGEICSAKADPELETLFKIVVAVESKKERKIISYLLEVEEEKHAKPLLLSLTMAVAASQSKFMQRGASIKDIQRARSLVEQLQTQWGFLEPDRGDLDKSDIQWKHGKPDYTVTNLAYFLGKTKNHPAGSLELVVENLVKTWEMEATHKPYEEWTTVNFDKYKVSANGAPFIDGADAAKMGNYNWLLSTCPKKLYDAESISFDESHDMFLKAFPHGFPFEVMEVYSGPPKVAFSWRHWAAFAGEFQGNRGNGDVVDLTGFGVVELEDMKMTNLEIFYDPTIFLETLLGEKSPRDLKSSGAARGEPVVLSSGCPFLTSSDKQDCMPGLGVLPGVAPPKDALKDASSGVQIPGLEGYFGVSDISLDVESLPDSIPDSVDSNSKTESVKSDSKPPASFASKERRRTSY